MAQNITIAGASYSNVPRIDVPKTGGGIAQFCDTSDATATADKIMQGFTAWANGVKLSGTATGGGGGGGSGGSVSSKDINFYDGENIVESWSLDELQSKTALPPNPTRDGLISQGWNFTLADLKATNQAMNVGQMYITDDGATRFYIWLPSEDDLTACVRFTCSVSGGTTIEWGDGATTVSSGTSDKEYSHTYAATGYYTIIPRRTRLLKRKKSAARSFSQ